MRKKGRFQVQTALSQLKQLPDANRQLVVPALIRQARLVISSGGQYKGLAQITPPFMLGAGKKDNSSSSAFARGKKAVARDIQSVYGAPWKMFNLIKQFDAVAARAFWALMTKERNFAKANALALKITGRQMVAFDDGTAHRGRRDNRGRVSGRNPSIYVTDIRSINRYIKLRQANVGLLASALVAPGEQRLGAIRGVAEWVRRHSNSAWGTVKVIDAETGAVVQMEAHVPYGGVGLQRLFNAALEFRLDAFGREIPNILRAAIKKVGLTGRL